MKELYNTTKNHLGKYNKPQWPVRNKEGNPFTEAQEQRIRWIVHFKNLWPILTPVDSTYVEFAHTSLSINVISPATEEISKAIRQIKICKAAEPDSTWSETEKSDIDATAKIFYVLFWKIWEEGQVSTNWGEEYFIKIRGKEISATVRTKEASHYY